MHADTVGLALWCVKRVTRTKQRSKSKQDNTVSKVCVLRVPGGHQPQPGRMAREVETQVQWQIETKRKDRSNIRQAQTGISHSFPRATHRGAYNLQLHLHCHVQNRSRRRQVCPGNNSNGLQALQSRPGTNASCQERKQKTSHRGTGKAKSTHGIPRQEKANTCPTGPNHARQTVPAVSREVLVDALVDAYAAIRPRV